jgi:hypothetical protein
MCPQVEARRGEFPVESTGQVWRGFWCHGAECLLGATVRVRVPNLLRVLVSGSESCKKYDKQLTLIVRVMHRRSHFY